MFLRRSIAVATCFVALAGCSDGTTAPKSAVFDTFGAPLMQMTATRHYVRIQLPCTSLFIEDAYVVPDADGQFALPETPVLGDRAYGAKVSVSGRLSGDRIDATVRVTSPSNTFVSEHVLVRGQRADFSGIACLA